MTLSILGALSIYIVLDSKTFFARSRESVQSGDCLHIAFSKELQQSLILEVITLWQRGQTFSSLPQSAHVCIPRHHTFISSQLKMQHQKDQHYQDTFSRRSNTWCPQPKARFFASVQQIGQVCTDRSSGWIQVSNNHNSMHAKAQNYNVTSYCLEDRNNIPVDHQYHCPVQVMRHSSVATHSQCQLIGSA